nr:TetR/AcrR family transcriptional regulator C-terminal domain-containing protein [Microbacterium telephonicum]
MAHEIRSIAIEHPRAFPLVATRHPAAPWLRPPLRSIEVVDAFLDTLIRQGFTDEQAVDAYRSFTSFLLGLLLLESAVRGASTGREDGARNGPDDGADSDSDAAGLEAAPQVRRLRPLLSEDRGDAEFEASLEDLLDRIGRGIAP